MQTNNEAITPPKSFWDSGHFFRDIALVLILVQISIEFKEVMATFPDMWYGVAFVASTLGNIVPFIFKMTWCFILMLMFIFTLGGTSRWPLIIQIFVSLILIVKYTLFFDIMWISLLSFSIVIYYIALKEAKRREVRQYMSDVLPYEKEMPFWALILAFIVLNIAFTAPAYKAYSKKLKEVDVEYQKTVSKLLDVSVTVTNVKQTANNITQSIANSDTVLMFEYYLKKMMTGKAEPVMKMENKPSSNTIIIP